MSNSSVQYDQAGRMKYHPDYHENHKKPYTVKELAYICANYYKGNRKNLSMAVGRTEATIAKLVCGLKKEGLFETYQKMGKEHEYA